MSWSPNLFAPAVLSNIRHLQDTSKTGVGYILPGGDKIGLCLQYYIDDQIKAQNKDGNIRINPLSDTGTVFNRFV